MSEAESTGEGRRGRSGGGAARRAEPAARTAEAAAHSARRLVDERNQGLIDADVSWQDKAHFMAVAARTMRRVLRIEG